MSNFFDDAWLQEYLAQHPQLAARMAQAASAAPAPLPLPPVPREPPGVSRTLTDRYRSKGERRYAQCLDVRQHAGELRQWWYEPFKGLYLAPETSITLDFLVEHTTPGLMLELHEVKGPFINPASWQKLKQAAARYPCFRFVLAQWKQGAWRYKEIPSI